MNTLVFTSGGEISCWVRQSETVELVLFCSVVVVLINFNRGGFICVEGTNLLI